MLRLAASASTIDVASERIGAFASVLLIQDLNSLPMNDESGPLAADRDFFAALSRGLVEDLDRVIADDFILIEVMGARKSPNPLS